jgi:hypothetical protein
VASVSYRRFGKLLIFYRKFQLESTSPRLIVANPDEPVMVGDDSRNNSKSEPGAALARRKIGLKNSGTDTWVDASAVIGNFEHDHAIG